MNQRDFVIRAYENDEQMELALKLAKESDMVIFGACPQSFEDVRIAEGKPFFRYSERFFKKIKFKSALYVWWLFRKHHGGKRNKKALMLCASAFTPADAAKVGAYIGKCYRWGYFPEVKEYPDIEKVIDAKKKNSILWVARMLELKHPEAPVLVAERLKEEGYEFTLNMIGTGEKFEYIQNLIKEKGLEENIKMLGSMSPDEVRRNMEEASVFLFTSNKQEGWGAVLNESMNSGCAVVASHAIGSVPFLLKDKENGLIYRSGDIEDLYNKVKYLLDNPEEAKRMGTEAYKTLAEQWNAKNAAERFMALANEVLKGNENPDLFDEGVCSKAPVLKNNWY